MDQLFFSLKCSPKHDSIHSPLQLEHHKYMESFEYYEFTLLPKYIIVLAVTYGVVYMNYCISFKHIITEQPK